MTCVQMAERWYKAMRQGKSGQQDVQGAMHAWLSGRPGIASAWLTCAQTFI